MCGIIGINSNKPVSATIINSLKKYYQVIDIEADSEITIISQKITEKLGLN